MTDTKQICEAIKGLPDNDRLQLHVRPTYKSDELGMNRYLTTESDASIATDDLKTLVAENEALRERVADANRGAQVNALVNESLAKKLKLAVEALSDARSHLFAIYNGDWPSDISPTPAGFAQFAVNDIDATLAKIKEPSKGRDV
jgi:hypothetical protein